MIDKNNEKNKQISLFVKLYGIMSLVLVPVIFIMLEMYPTSSERLESIMSPAFIETPSESQLLEICKKEIPGIAKLTVNLQFKSDKKVYNGVEAVYDIKSKERIEYKLFLFRHDIECSVCTDILAISLYDMRLKKLNKIILIAPWEVQGEYVETREFIAQFSNKPLNTKFKYGDNVDGLSGATKSVQGLIDELNKISQSLDKYSNLMENIVQTNQKTF